MGMIINKKIYRKATKKLDRYAKNRLPKETLAEFKKNTPVAKPPPAGTIGGNARIKTTMRKSISGFKITGNYPYSGVIDKGEYPKNPKGGFNKTRDGYSKQAPNGIIQPTVDFMRKQIMKFIRRNT